MLFIIQKKKEKMIMKELKLLQRFEVIKDELLKYAIANGMIDLSYVQEQIEMKERGNLLSNLRTLTYGIFKYAKPMF